tara:strand:- start:192 stop:575 length:384 start_codon:yes stop_codon:yes gene_type:complete
MKPERKLYQKFKKNTPLIQHTRIETYINHGVPDCLCYHDNCGFFMVELKHTTNKNVSFSPHQILWATQKSKRNFLLLEHTPPRLPSSIKLYESKSIEGLLLDHREVKPLAVNDWQLIQKILINQKNN